MATAFWQCLSMRTANVLMPRRTRKQSNGPGTAPVAFWRKAILSATASFEVATKPPTTSLCPLRYLVVECTTISAPWATGCWR